MEVVLERGEEMNLLGLFMQAALESRAERVEKMAPSGDIAMTAGAMSVTLCFGDGPVVIRKGVAGKPRAHLKGSLEALIEIARGNTFGPLLRRRARLSGNPLAALPLARVFR